MTVSTWRREPAASVTRQPPAGATPAGAVHVTFTVRPMRRSATPVGRAGRAVRGALKRPATTGGRPRPPVMIVAVTTRRSPWPSCGTNVRVPVDRAVVSTS